MATKRKTTIPEDFEISPNVVIWATKRGHQDNLAAHHEAFIAKCQAHGYEYVNWDAAFREAIRADWAGLNAKPRAKTFREIDAENEEARRKRIHDNYFGKPGGRIIDGEVDDDGR